MISAIFQGFLILLVFILALHNWRLVVRNAHLRIMQRHLSEHVAANQHHLDLLKAYVADDVLFWYPDNNDRLDEIPTIKNDAVVLIKGEDLKGIYHSRWNEGYDNGSLAADALNQVKVLATSGSLDGHYRDHVNELRQVALEFAGTQQLRARIADKVIGFRQNLVSLQHGVKMHFPQGPSRPGHPVPPKRPKAKKDRSSTWTQF